MWWTDSKRDRTINILWSTALVLINRQGSGKFSTSKHKLRITILTAVEVQNVQNSGSRKTFTSNRQQQTQCRQIRRSIKSERTPPPTVSLFCPRCHWPVGNLPGSFTISCTSHSLRTLVGSHVYLQPSDSPDEQTHEVIPGRACQGPEIKLCHSLTSSTHITSLGFTRISQLGKNLLHISMKGCKTEWFFWKVITAFNSVLLITLANPTLPGMGNNPKKYSQTLEVSIPDLFLKQSEQADNERLCL